MAKRFFITKDNLLSFSDAARGWSDLAEARVLTVEGQDKTRDETSGSAAPRVPFYTNCVWFHTLPKEYRTALRDHRLHNLKRLHAPGDLDREPCTEQCWGFLCRLTSNIRPYFLPIRDEYSGFLSAFSFSNGPPIREGTRFDPACWKPALRRFLPPQLMIQFAIWHRREEMLGGENRGHVPAPPGQPKPEHLWSVFAWYDSFRLLRESQVILNALGSWSDRLQAAKEYHSG